MSKLSFGIGGVVLARDPNNEKTITKFSPREVALTATSSDPGAEITEVNPTERTLTGIVESGQVSVLGYSIDLEGIDWTDFDKRGVLTNEFRQGVENILGFPVKRVRTERGVECTFKVLPGRLDALLSGKFRDMHEVTPAPFSISGRVGLPEGCDENTKLDFSEFKKNGWFDDATPARVDKEVLP